MEALPGEQEEPAPQAEPVQIVLALRRGGQPPLGYREGREVLPAKARRIREGDPHFEVLLAG